MARTSSVRGRPTVLLTAVVLVAGAVLAPPSSAQAPGPADQVPATRTVEAGTGWRQVTTGASFTCGIRFSGQLRCWGRDSYGAVGDGGAPDLVRYVPSPTPVAGPVTSWLSVDASYAHACAISTEHRLYCWGDNHFGATGVGSTAGYQYEPTEVSGQTADWASVSAGGYTTCGRKLSGALLCWGDDRFGTLGDGDPNESRAVPGDVAGQRDDWADVSVGFEHACATTNAGLLYCWGHDADGELGDDATTTDRSAPTEVAGSYRGWRNVETGFAQTCATRGRGRAFCWGRDGYERQLLPVEVRGHRNDWTHLAVGSETCAGRTDGRDYCWRGVRAPQAGSTFTSRPSEVPGSHADWVDLRVGSGHRCGLRTGGRLFCWGSDRHGEIGDGAPRRPQARPVRIP